MLEVKQLTEEFCNSLTVKEKGDYAIVTPLFFHIESDESIALKFSENKDGRLKVTDCGTTVDYLEIMNIDLEKYRDKLEAIKERFFIEEENGSFITLIPTSQPEEAVVYVGCFIQGLCMIANIDL